GVRDHLRAQGRSGHPVQHRTGLSPRARPSGGDPRVQVVLAARARFGSARDRRGLHQRPAGGDRSRAAQAAAAAGHHAGAIDDSSGDDERSRHARVQEVVAVDHRRRRGRGRRRRRRHRRRARVARLVPSIARHARSGRAHGELLMRALALGVVLAAAALGGCSSTTAVDLTVALGGDVAAHTAELSTLALHVDGDVAPFDRTLDVAGKFGSGRETLEYVPKVGSGTLTFTITLADAAATTLGTGSASVPLVAHKAVALTVPVGSGAAGDDMTTPDDLTTPSSSPDMTMPCAAIEVSTLAGTGAAGYVDGAGNVAQFQM